MNTKIEGLGDPTKAETDEVVNTLISKYVGNAATPVERIFRDETEALLSAILLELRDEKSIPDAAAETDEATYAAVAVTVDDDGPTDQAPPSVDGTKIDLGAIYSGFNLRFSDAVEVAFKESGKRWIPYRADESPVTGVQAETRYVWVRAHDDAATDPTVIITGGI